MNIEMNNSFIQKSSAKVIVEGIDCGEPNSENINLVFASDNNYFPFTITTLISTLKNYNGNQLISVFLLVDQNLNERNTQEINELKNKYKFECEQIIVEASLFNGIKTSEGISIATYYRLLMHDLLPERVEKALYLDSDLIIRGSIDELYNSEFDSNIFIGVEDSISIDYNKKFGIPPYGHHINAGVLLINLKLIREFDFLELIKIFLSINKYRITLGDQQIICEIFYDLIKYTDVKWNVHGSMFQPDWIANSLDVKNNMNLREVERAIKNPSIIHYTLKRKPWVSLEHPKSKLWFEYLKLTSFYSDYSDLLKTKKTFKNKGAQSQRKKDDRKKITFSRFFRKLLPGYINSIKNLRKTRLLTEDINNRIQALDGSVSNIRSDFKNSTSVSPVNMYNIIGIPTGSTRRNQPRKSDLSIKLKSILISRAASLPTDFSALEYVTTLPCDLIFQSNFVSSDVDGGTNENIKMVLKTSNVLYSSGKKADAVLIHCLRLEQGMFWDSLEYAYLYDKPLLFSETTFFGGFASYYDKQATLEQRRAFGFVLDDMGYYFDARQPSRMEQILNSSDFVISDRELKRAKQLIKRIIDEKITKYNKYSSKDDMNWKPESDSVLVIEQKMDDASIVFSDGHRDDFQAMVHDACTSYPNKMVYFKRHPDNILSNKSNGLDLNYGNLVVVPDEISVTDLMDYCGYIYTVSSQVGFEGLLRKKMVFTYGKPFYSGWGLTVDKNKTYRRNKLRTIEELFYVACIKMSVYYNPQSNRMMSIEEAFDYIKDMKRRCK